MNYRTPESQGVDSRNILAYVKMLEENHVVTHDIIIARGNNILYEDFRPPFTPDFCHRMYSVTKSIVAIAAGFAWQEGLLDLDKPVTYYFEKELEGQTDENMRSQTIRNMLMMSTAKPSENWFTARTDDRVRFYFQNKRPQTRKPGTIFEYDSTGSFVVGALVERVTGQLLMDYLRSRLFDKIGVSDSIRCLVSPGGHSWGDSAMLARPHDLLLIARFMLNGGSWNGEQLLDAGYVREATSKLIDTGNPAEKRFDGMGYGYLIWKCYGEGFFFNGMGCQFAVCIPERDMILIFNGDNQGNEKAKYLIWDGFYDMIAMPAGDQLNENPEAQKALADYIAPLKLRAAWGETDSPIAEKISGVEYKLNENPMGITRFRLTIENGEGRFDYTNAQGDKSIAFGMCENRFGEFPQKGYSDLVGSQPGNRLYKCAASAAWKEENLLDLKIQIIDDYFGNMDALFTFDGDNVKVVMTKSAEDFLEEYKGQAVGHKA
ncbi:MAG: serine hydrolase [Clostridia bacterium]|nr:serine hydrolase [Clostridia bacterium]